MVYPHAGTSKNATNVSSSSYEGLVNYRIHSTSEHEPPFKLGRASKDVLFGSAAGMVAKVFEHPFDLVKVRLQTQSVDRPIMYQGAWDCFRQTYTKEGARGLFRGLSMPILGATMENATLFFTYNFVQGKLRDMNGTSTPSSSSSSLEADAERPLSMAQLSIAAAAAGSVTSFVLTPVELIKCKMQVQMVSRELDVLAKVAASQSNTTGSISKDVPRNVAAAVASSSHSNNATTPLAARALSTKAFADLDGPVKIFMDVLKREGPTGLWLGQTGTLLRETGGGMAWFLGFEWACRTMIERKRHLSGRDNITKKDLSTLQLIGAGALAGVSYNVILFPADVVKSNIQIETNSGPGSTKSGFFSTFKQIYRTKGIQGLYAGCGVTCLRSAPSSALIFLLYNKLEALADDYGI